MCATYRECKTAPSTRRVYSTIQQRPVWRFEVLGALGCHCIRNRVMPLGQARWGTLQWGLIYGLYHFVGDQLDGSTCIEVPDINQVRRAG
jgi:hypothetical protein